MCIRDSGNIKLTGHMWNLAVSYVRAIGITGKRPAVTEATEELTTQTSTLIQRELDNSSFYRDILLALPQGELRDYLFEIFSDAQNHSLILMNIPKE